MAILTQTDVETLLLRSLSTAESTAFETFENIAEQTVADALCAENLTAWLTESGLSTYPDDLKLLIARLFNAEIQDGKKEFGVSSKSVEDFSISYDNGSAGAVSGVLAQGSAILQKYSLCGGMRHGRIMREQPEMYNDSL